jgi:hypothetical protein
VTNTLAKMRLDFDKKLKPTNLGLREIRFLSHAGKDGGMVQEKDDDDVA